MSKWFGKVGYSLPETETSPGIWEALLVEHEYYGEITSDKRRHQNSGEINSGVALANVISIIADPFAYENCSYIAYVEIMGTKWSVTEIDASQRPRLILTVGGVWNGNTP